MTIWILALLLLAVGAGMGLRQGAIRVAISFVGIILSALLAWPLSGIFRPLLPHVGIHNSFVIQLVAPVLVFLVLLSGFKSLGFWAHRRADVYYRYKAADYQQILWERVNRRLGMCLGLLNGLVYFVLISLVIYNLSYWSVQVAPTSEESLSVRVLDRMGWDLQNTGVIRIARAIDPMPQIYFKMADLAGLIVQNPQLLNRLSDYPAFLSLSEREDFKQLGQNAEFQSAWKAHGPLRQLWDDSQVLAIRQSADIANLVWNLATTNLDDLYAYLQTGQTAKFSSEPILGHWDFNVMLSLTAFVQIRVDVTSSDMAALRGLWSQAYAKTVLVAGADGQVFLKNFPQFKMQPNQPTTFDTTSWQGQWKQAGNNYDITFTGSGASKSGTGTINGSRLTIQTDSGPMIFDREE